MTEGRRFCENCGTAIGEATRFCPNCGKEQTRGRAGAQDGASGIPETGRVSTPYAPDVPPPPPSRGRSWLKIVLGGCGALVLLFVLVIACAVAVGTRGGGSGAGSSGSGGTGQSPSASSGGAAGSSKSSSPKQQEDPNPHFGDGTQRVGSDIQAGTYRTRKGSSGCYYARLSGFGGGTQDILANDNTNGPAVITIAPTDAGFESKRCGTWTQDLSQITDSTTSFNDGTYIVGTDIEPGTYRSNGSSGCYYARLSGFGGGTESVIANNNTDTPAIVEIGPTDVGFESKRCGSWQKMG